MPTASEVNVPGARTRHSSVWTGNEMIVWGGLSEDASGEALGTGGRYNPAIDVWTPTSLVAAPTARERHTAVWTGAEMIVWGGHPGRNYPPYPTNDGARYDPLLDRWTATSTGVNVPRARMWHSAVWTGTEMIVWGGVDAGPSSDTFLNTGGRYDPAANTWIATSISAGVPAARMRHSAVWTGSQMIVWGGYTTNSTNSGQNTGGRYSPATNTWAATSIGTGVATPRAGHTAVWSGSEMIVWGGAQGSTHTGNGSRYNPVTDGWTAVPTGPTAPSARSEHIAVWTGREMIVWGGTSNVAPWLFNTGARFDPAAGTWTPTSIGANVPPHRMGHSAAWTGSEMIVWGGSATVSTAGRYCACPSGLLVYRDVDGDGSGRPSQSIPSCDGSVPAGYSATGSDCNDANSSIHPGAAEPCDAIDNDCDGLVDEGDSDVDAILDACDNCPAVANTAQSDFDGDGEGDACDLNDGTIWQWRDDKVSVSWQEEAGPASWNVYIGNLAVLKGTGVYTQIPGSNPLAARVCGITQTTVAETGVPGSGAASFSLVSGTTGKSEGSLGSSSSGPRPNTNPCP